MSNIGRPVTALLVAAVAVFTVWITWRAKALEARIDSVSRTNFSVRGKPAPDFALAGLDGRRVALADFRGKKKLVVSFWASWCAPCRMEMPELRAFYKKAHKADSDFDFVAIGIDDERAPVEDFARQSDLPFPVVWDRGQKTATAYGVESIPHLFVIDRDGTFLYSHTGFDVGLEPVLASMLGVKDYPIAGAPNAAGH
jgi:peroxiredoxin